MAIVSEQGSEYEEDLVNEEYDEEGDEDTDSKLTSLFGIPIKFLIIGGAVLLLILIAVIVFMFRGSGDDDIVYPEQQQTPIVQDEPTTVDTPPVQAVDPQSDTTTFMLWTDAAGDTVGVSTGSAEGSIVSKDDITVGTISWISGTPVNSVTGVSAYFQAAAAPTSTSEEVLDINTQLRKLGYTGDEIAAAQSSGADLNAMIESAQALRDAEAAEALRRMSDSASEEFLHMAEYSVFSMDFHEFPETENSYERVIQQGNYVVNADYWKVDTYGNQLFIKLKIANNQYAFMTLSPERWAQIPETGNMVVKISYYLYGMTNTVVQFYITDITEMDVAQVTVNPEDSATDLNEIIGMDAIMGGTE